MLRKKLLAGTLSLAMVLTMLPVGSMGTTTVSAADSQTPTEITLDKTWANPIGGGTDADGNLIYGGDPSILVDGDTVYLYCGHDTSTTDAYYMPEWICYSTKDLKTWTYEGVIMTADKESITWANTGTDAWAGQIAKHKDPATGKDMYYFYYCTWDKDANDSQSNGKQSIGVAVSDSPTGGFKDIGKPLVSGTVTTNETSGWNDIDPTVWIETDSDGVEHRYLNWGNGKNFTCELNEDMISVKDINGDGQITFGTQAGGATSKTADIIEMTAPSTFTEAPWLYRRQDSDGNYYGDYYLFYAYGWREQMAYATIDANDGLMDGTWTYGTNGENGLLMEPAATSNTNHMAVFDFQGKTYFVYHNGSLPGGSGFRRVANIAEVHFNEDGSIQPIPETAVGIFGTTTTLYTSKGLAISHASFNNSSSDDVYPYTDIEIGLTNATSSADAQWAIVAGKADPTNDAYVSIQSENKPGLYLTVNDDNSVTLAQDYDFNDLTATAKKQTFRTVAGLGDSDGVSFESVSNPGYYLTIASLSSKLTLTDGSNADACTFYTSKPAAPADANSENAITQITPGDDTVITEGDNNTYTADVSYKSSTLKAAITLADSNGFFSYNSSLYESGDTVSINIEGDGTKAEFDVYAENGELVNTYTLTLHLDFTNFSLADDLIYSYGFEDSTDGAYAVTKSTSPVTVENPTYTYDEGKSGKAIKLSGSYGLKLANGKKLGDSYTISFWMKPEKLNGSVDPILAGGTFAPQYWFNLTCDAKIWSYNGEYIDTGAANAYTAGEWQNIVLSVDGNYAKLYRNGTLISEGTIAENILTKTNAAIYFGVNGWDAYYTGLLDEVTMYNRALTNAEISKIADSTVTVASVGTPQYTPNSNQDYFDDVIEIPDDANTTNSLKGITVKDNAYTVKDNGDGTYALTIPYTIESLDVILELEDANGYVYYDGAICSDKTATISTSTDTTTAEFIVFAENREKVATYTLTITKDYSDYVYYDQPIKTFDFEDETDGAVAVTKASVPTEVSDATYSYVEGVNGGKAIYLDGTYGLKLTEGKDLGNSYTIAYWMKPDKLNGTFDPTLCAGTFDTQYWINLTFAAVIWSYNGGYIDTTTMGSYKANEWQHVALTVEGTTGRLYRNGILICSGTVADGVMTNPGAFVYFGVNAWDAYYVGALDEVKMYNRRLETSEVKALAGVTDTDPDNSGSGNTGSGSTGTGSTGTGNTNTGTTTTKKTNTITAKNYSKTAKASKQTFSIGAKAATTLTYSSNNKKITVSKTGKVTIAKNYSGKATITIKAASNATYKAATKKITVTVKPAKVTKSSIKATSKKKTVTVKFKKAAGAVKYKVEVSTSKKFTKKTTKSVTVKKTTATIKKLKANKKYYVRVTAIGNNSVQASAVVAKKTVKTKK